MTIWTMTKYSTAQALSGVTKVIYMARLSQKWLYVTQMGYDII